MKIRTKPYGEIEVDEKQRLTFPEGVIGFEGISDYFLIDSKEGPFYWLQSAQHAELAFLLINPRLFVDDYKLQVRSEELQLLQPESEDDLLDFAIVTVPEDHDKISANLMGPVVVNRRTRVGMQVISENDSYGVKHFILEEMKKRRGQLVETG
jgi:flagellar assembly factor FliW